MVASMKENTSFIVTSERAYIPGYIIAPANGLHPVYCACV